MEVHSPKHLDLPPLRINHRSERVSIEESPEIQGLIKTKLLLDASFNSLLMELLGKTKKLDKLIELVAKGKYDPLGKWVVTQSEELSLFDFAPEATFTNFLIDQSSLFTDASAAGPESQNLSTSKDFTIPLDKSSIFLSTWEKTIEAKATEARKTVLKEIIKLSDELQNDLSGYENKHHIDIPILSPAPLYICAKCGRIVSVTSFRMLKCQCGTNISSVSNVLQVLIKHFSDNVIKFMEANYWFEHGIAHLLRQKNIEVMVGIEVLGHSGMWHEIDVIGESKQQNYRIFAECKNADVKASHVFVFVGKMNDIGCTRGYIFTTSKEVSLQITRLARSKNISIVTDVLQKPNKSLLEELTDI